MSHALSIAAVTAILKELLTTGLAERSVRVALGAPVPVTTLPLDQLDGLVDGLKVNLHMVHLSPDPAARRPLGEMPDDERLAYAQLAVHLRYLITPYGATDLQSEIVLGYVMRLMHEHPVLSRDDVRRTLAATSAAGPSIWPPMMAAWRTTDLAEEMDMISVAAMPISLDDLSGIWRAYGARYRPSVAYEASFALVAY